MINISLLVINGLDVIKEIRTISPTVPIIAITSNDFYLEQKQALKYGCSDVMSKPFSISKLEEYVLAFVSIII